MNIKTTIKKKIDKFKQNAFVSKLFKNMFISFLGEGGASVIAFFSTIALIRIIGSEKYGILVVAYSFILIIDSFVNSQTWQAMVKFGSEAIEEKDYPALERLIKIGTIVDLFTAILGTVLSITTAAFFSELLGWNAQTTQSIYLMAFMILFNFTGTAVGIIRLLDRFVLFSIFRIATELIRFALIIVFCALLKLGIKGAALSYLLGYVIGYIILFVFFVNEIKKHEYLSLKRIISSKAGYNWKEILRFIFWSSMTSKADIPVQQFDMIFLSMLSYDMVAVFKVYKQIGQLLTRFTTPMKQAIMPLFSELISQKKYSECYSYYSKIISKGNKFMFPAILVMTGGSLFLLGFVLDEMYVSNWPILLAYLLLRGFALSYAPIHPLFIALGQVKKNFIISLIANSMYIVIIWILISSIGVWAILLGLLVEYLIIVFGKQRIVRKILLK